MKIIIEYILLLSDAFENLPICCAIAVQIKMMLYDNRKTAQSLNLDYFQLHLIP